jgi:outer membrane protein assembly factor BamB
MKVWQSFFCFLVLSSCASIRPGPIREVTPVLKRGWTYSENSRESKTTLEAGVTPVDFSSPVENGDHIVLATARIGLVVIHKDNGQVIWKRLALNETFSGKPLIAKNLIIIGSEEGYMHAFRLDNGQQVWKVPVPAPARGESVIIGDTVVFSCADESVHANDVMTGKELWTHRRPSYAGTSIFGGGNPAIIGGQIWIGFSDGTLTALDANDGSVKLEKNFRDNIKFNDIDARPLSWKENVIVATYDGKLRMLKRDGTTIWEFQAGGARSPVIATLDGASILLLSSSEGSIFAINIENGQEIWHYNLKRGIPTGLTFIDGPKPIVVSASSNEFIFALDMRTGKEMSRISLGQGSGSYSTPVADAKRRSVFILSQFSRLYQLQIH